MLNIGVFVSGGGTNLQAIIDNIAKGALPGVRIAVVVSSKENAYALQRAGKYEIPAFHVSKKDFSRQEDYDREMTGLMERYNVDLVVLAGFTSMLGKDFVSRFENRIINIHPSLIPSFCGKGCYGIEPHRKALEKGVKITGATVHFIDQEYDSGPIILQKAVAVLEGDTPEILQKRVMEEAEWVILPEAIRLISEGRVKVENGKTIIT